MALVLSILACEFECLTLLPLMLSAGWLDVLRLFFPCCFLDSGGVISLVCLCEEIHPYKLDGLCNWLDSVTLGGFLPNLCSPAPALGPASTLLDSPQDSEEVGWLLSVFWTIGMPAFRRQAAPTIQVGFRI